ncbi:MAG: hypothetical protein HFG20_10760 [Anaerotruncus sp.]|jgi:hypothetical protein|nr:hypothetical protein [Anaerotruncus sp.]
MPHKTPLLFYKVEETVKITARYKFFQQGDHRTDLPFAAYGIEAAILWDAVWRIP